MTDKLFSRHRIVPMEATPEAIFNVAEAITKHRREARAARDATLTRQGLWADRTFEPSDNSTAKIVVAAYVSSSPCGPLEAAVEAVVEAARDIPSRHPPICASWERRSCDCGTQPLIDALARLDAIKEEGK